MSPDNWEQQPGGLNLAVTPFNKTISDHREAASSILRDTVRTIADVHGAEFSNRSFHNNLHAIYTGDIKLDLFLAKWEVCERKPPIYLGAALSWDTVGINSQGSLGRALYTEDVCLLTGQLRKLIKAKPDGKDFPDESLLERFERISLHNLKTREGAWYKFGEVNPENTRMMRSMENNGGTFGRIEESAVLEFQKLPSDLSARFPMNIQPIGLRKDGIFDKNNFVARWNHAEHDVRFIVTRAQATASGEHRVDIRPWHNGNLPNPEVFECVVASALTTIKEEVEVVRKWGQTNRNRTGPSIPLFEPSGHIARATYGDASNELFMLPANKLKTFDLSMPDAHIHIVNDKPTLDTFVRMGAAPRLFGEKPMVPGVNVLKNNRALVA